MDEYSILIRECKIVNSDIKDNVDIYIKNGIIKEIKDNFLINEIFDDNLRIINANGMYIMPSIIDSHVHLILNSSNDIINYVRESDSNTLLLNAKKNIQKCLKNGITTVRDMGCKDFIVPFIKQKIQKGEYIGPRIFSAGHMITKRNGHVKYISNEINGSIGDIQKAISEQIDGGADFIKLIISGGLLSPNTSPLDNELKKDNIERVVEEANKYNLNTAAHVYSDNDVINAVEAGAHSIEHGTFASLKTLKKAAIKNVFFIPTIKAAYDIMENSDSLSSYVAKNAESVLKESKNVIKNAMKSKICIVMGTDSGTPFNYHGDNLRELELMTEMGLSNEEAINSATVNASKLLGKSDVLGSVKTGFIADLLLTVSNPLDDIGIIRKDLKYIIHNGKIIKDPFHCFLK